MQLAWKNYLATEGEKSLKDGWLVVETKVREVSRNVGKVCNQ